MSGDRRSRSEAFNCRHSKKETQRLSEFDSGRSLRQYPHQRVVMAIKGLNV